MLPTKIVYTSLTLLVAMLFTSCGDGSRDKLEQSRVKSIIINSRAFATDNSGKYPTQLADLHPKYIELVSNFYSPPHKSNEVDAQAYYYRSGIRVGSKIDEPIVVSPHVIKGFVNVGYVGGFVRRLAYEDAKGLLDKPDWQWNNHAPPLKGGLTVR